MPSLPNACDTVARLLSEARCAVAFTGAGISTESGIPDFRSPGGVWSRHRQIMYDEFMRDPSARLEYWRQRCDPEMDMSGAQPNTAHRVLAGWEEAGRLLAVITQNIDGLHQLAGSRCVVELHGTARRVKCQDCAAEYEARPFIEEFRATSRVPSCPACLKGRLKLATISFGQALNEDVLQQAIDWANRTDLMLAIGSSLVVEPAASLPRLVSKRGARLVIINREPTRLDATADVVLRGSCGELLSEIARRLDALGGGEGGMPAP